MIFQKPIFGIPNRTENQDFSFQSDNFKNLIILKKKFVCYCQILAFTCVCLLLQFSPSALGSTFRFSHNLNFRAQTILVSKARISICQSCCILFLMRELKLLLLLHLSCYSCCCSSAFFSSLHNLRIRFSKFLDFQNSQIFKVLRFPNSQIFLRFSKFLDFKTF